MTTRAFADGLHALAGHDLGGPVRAAALRSLLDVLGCAVGAAGTSEVDRLVAHASAVSGAATCPVPGRAETLDVPGAALVTGFAACLEARPGGTHVAAQLQPAAASVSAALPLVSNDSVAGPRLLDALALGMEAQLRVALAMAPSHAEAGWLVAGTVGPVGAAVTAAVLMDLDADQLRHAVAIATSMSLGHGESAHGPAGAFVVGKAAVNGVLAATLARRGSTGAEKAFEGPRGYFHALAPSADPTALTDGLGTSWALLDLTSPPGPDGAPGPSSSDEELDARASERVELTLPGSGRSVVAAVRALPDAEDCAALLSATTPETP